MGFQSHERQAGIIRYAREAGWNVDSRLLSYHAIGQDRAYLGSLAYDGVLALCSRAAPWLPGLLRGFTVPIVDMWADYPNLRYARVLLDHAAIGRAGAEHLLSRGFRDLLFYTHAIEGKGARRRAQSFRDVVAAAGARYHELTWDHESPPPRRGLTRIAWLAEWLSGASLPIGVMGSNDHIACEVLEAAALAGLQVPRQVAVLGVDDDPVITELAQVPLSSVDSARERVGYEAAVLLDRLMDGQPAPSEPVLVPPARVVARRSTDVLAVRDPEVAAAIQFIQDRFRDPITVEDVAAQARVSRRHLQDVFRGATGRTIRDTIAWQRVDHAKGLLAGTRTKVQLIARQAGFGTGENMSKVFRRMLGITPQQFREQHGHGAASAPPADRTSTA